MVGRHLGVEREGEGMAVYRAMPRHRACLCHA